MQDLLDRTVYEVSEGRVFNLLPAETQAAVRELPIDEVREAASNGLTRPQPGSAAQNRRLLMNPCLAVQWLALFETLDLPRRLRVFEPCVGAGEPVILATEIYSDGRGEYTSINLNRDLRAQLLRKLGKVRMAVRIIEDNVTRPDAVWDQEAVDIACFHHAINDILQTAVSEPRGMDTRTLDWWPNERQMIEWLAEDEKAGRLDDRARPALIQAVRFALDLVRPDGYLLFDHWTWEAHRNLDWFPWELFCALIPLARGWITESGLPMTEIPLPGRDPQWWMGWKKAASIPT